MRLIYFCRIALISVWIVLVAVACHSGNKVKPVQEITAIEAYGALQNGFAVLVDARETSDWKQGAAAPAVSFPFSQLRNDEAWKSFTSGLNPDKRVIVYCKDHACAGIVAQKLFKSGFQAANLGPYTSWTRLHLPTKKP